jgi:hypothetical protein
MERLTAEREAAIRHDDARRSHQGGPGGGFPGQDGGQGVGGAIVRVEADLDRAMKAQYSNVRGKEAPPSHPNRADMAIAGMIDSARIQIRKPLACHGEAGRGVDGPGD